MTKYDYFMGMSIEEFARTRVHWDGDFGCYTNDTIEGSAFVLQGLTGQETPAQ
jgi:hypothetical protein